MTVIVGCGCGCVVVDVVSNIKINCVPYVMSHRMRNRIFGLCGQCTYISTVYVVSVLGYQNTVLTYQLHI